MGNKWSKEENLFVLDLYFKEPKGHTQKGYLIKELNKYFASLRLKDSIAHLYKERGDGSIRNKLQNYSSLDKVALGALSNASKKSIELFSKYVDDMEGLEKEIEELKIYNRNAK